MKHSSAPLPLRQSAPTPSARIPGICRVCGCTDDEGCTDGCWWADPLHTICTICAALDPAQKAERRNERIDLLWAHIDQLQEAVVALTLRRNLLIAENGETVL